MYIQVFICLRTLGGGVMYKLIYKKFEDANEWRVYAIYETDSLDIAIDSIQLLKDGLIIQLERVK